MLFKGYIMIFYITLYMIIVLASYRTSIRLITKRKSEDNTFEACKIKRRDLDIDVITEDLTRQISKKGTNGLFIDQMDKEYIVNKKDENKECSIDDKIVNNENGLMSNNLYPSNNICDHSKTKLPNGQSEIITGNPILTTDNESTIPESEGVCWRNLLATTGQKKIRHHYERLMQQQLENVSVYSYSNSMFLKNFLKFPSPIFTVDSIRVRFGSGFLNFLSTDQLIHVLATLLSSKLELTSAERTELVGMIFGCIDFSLEMNFNNDQIVSIVTVLLRSDVPHCFEQVFLTWKMWKVFTTEEQERILEVIGFNIDTVDEIGVKCGKETLVMLYLFVLNRDTDNSSMCEAFKESIVRRYGETQVLKKRDILDPCKYIKKNLLASNMLDTSLLDLPNVSKRLNDVILIKFKKLVRQNTSTKNRWPHSNHYGKRYKIHICYALTKFTLENAHSNSEGVIDICDRVYIKLEYIRRVFNRWVKVVRNGSYLADEREVNEFRNAYGAMRQIVQCDEYNSMMFFRLLHTMLMSNSDEKLFALILFNSTKENILREVNKSPEWTKHITSKNRKDHNFLYIENMFMRNADSNLILLKPHCPFTYVERINRIFVKLIEATKGMQRERYLYQQLLFHPKFEFFNNCLMKLYIPGLSKIGQLDNEERRVQIARDLIFNEYYYESAAKLSPELVEGKGNIEKFRIALVKECERHGNECIINNEREALKNLKIC
ncbi:hypothetical protein PAEPH01_0207 [Pancytospora epiphaga]|nr:hypothetical protein PAEPH01_0207 [Pancytospora epiphaga]